MNWIFYESLIDCEKNSTKFNTKFLNFQFIASPERVYSHINWKHIHGHSKLNLKNQITINKMVFLVILPIVRTFHLLSSAIARETISITAHFCSSLHQNAFKQTFQNDIFATECGLLNISAAWTIYFKTMTLHVHLIYGLCLENATQCALSKFEKGRISPWSANTYSAAELIDGFTNYYSNTLFGINRFSPILIGRFKPNYMWCNQISLPVYWVFKIPPGFITFLGIL